MDNVVSHDNWSLHRKGQLDQQKHQDKVKEAIKKNLADIVSEESIIMSDGKKTIKVPIRSLDEYRSRYNFHKDRHGGQGEGETKPGDVIGSDSSQQGPGKGQGAGDQPGTDYYEADVTIEELAEMIFEDLALPNLKDKRQQEIESESYRFKDVRKQGIMGNIDKKRTILENLKRNAMDGKAKIGGINPEDLRFKTWDKEIKYQSNAVVLAMMDTSGSMGTFEKYIARSFFFWMVRFLRTKYQNVKIVFIAHHTKAKEVTEEEFFTKGESGGTKCSSAYELALKIIEERYSPQDYNLYPFHFSDGDNLPSDNEKCVKLIKDMLKICNVFGYGEIINPYYRSSTLMSVYKRIQDKTLITVTIKDKTEVYPALRTFFHDYDFERTGEK